MSDIDCPACNGSGYLKQFGRGCDDCGGGGVLDAMAAARVQRDLERAEAVADWSGYD